MELVLAADVGGTKIEVGLVTSNGEVLDRQRVSSTDPVPHTADELFERLESAWNSILARNSAMVGSIVVAGVGCGGPMAPLGETVSPLNISVWREFPLRARLGMLCTQFELSIDVHIDNDAKALALAEGWIGAAAGETNFMAMVVSTGVGGGIVLDGRLLDGATGNAGHIGHVVVNPGGRVHAGIAGSLEGEASGIALAAHLGKPAAAADKSWRERTGRLVGRAAGSTANLLDLKLVVVAGSVALGYGDPFFAAAQAEVDQVALLDHSLGTRVVPAGLGADGPLVGAGAVGWRGMGRALGSIAAR